MGSHHHGGPDLRWALAAAALGAKAAHAASRHHGGHGCGPGGGARFEGPGFGWMFGGGPGGGPGPWGPPPGPWGRGPWARGGGPWGRGPKARKGNVRAAILALLAENPLNGYQIIQEINERSGGGWKPSPGAVYPALQQLADEGLIRGEEGEGRKTFHLTDEGRAYVEEHADELSEPWAEMTPDFGEGVPDLFKQVAQTGAAVMQVVHSGSPEQVAQAKDVLAEARRKLYLILAETDDTPDAAEE
ncbi:PadR family transcriptional regulator [Actinomadura barringtoniae]|uniref:PadR family transcriptional regulator n=1 Tax=Actinomadura barringtoniae TaxID=1427535 RepID=A0A939T4X0_9ACTN|nr:PadR family transcriptional regulator [Actinomadura barringtoniae]MBO2448794.1 PadR family transcriptional regulator [Actinomadura barringtoniae]